jgi:hypothetical protein
MNRRFHILLLAALVSGLAASEGQARSQPDEDEAAGLLDLPVLPGTGSEKDGLRVELSCSETKLRTSVAKLSWSSDPQLHARQRIDLTAHQDGFERGLYASLWPLQRGQEPQASALARRQERFSDPSLLPRLEELAEPARQRARSARLEGLEPGVIYRFRIATWTGQSWTSGPGVEAEGPLCVADLDEETEEP